MKLWLLFVALLATTTILACGGGSGTGNSGTNNRWNQMNWNQGTWGP